MPKNASRTKVEGATQGHHTHSQVVVTRSHEALTLENINQGRQSINQRYEIDGVWQVIIGTVIGGVWQYNL
jgi:hypothetical protein